MSGTTLSNLAISPGDLDLSDYVAEGAFGKVWKGKWNGKGGGITVAVKKIPVIGTTEKQRNKITTEVDILAQLRHPNILQIYGACFVERELWIVTEYMDGGSLFELLHTDSTPIAWDILLRLAHQAAVGLNVLHSHHTAVLHRDIKSLNFVVSKDLSTLKLIDFGLSKFITVISTIPRANTTLRWGAPETLDYPPVWSPAADVYSLGCTFYEIACRKLPFYETDDTRIKVVAQSEQRPDLPKCPDGFAEIIRKCWVLNATHRPTSLQILQQLETLVENELTEFQETSSDTMEWAAEDFEVQSRLNVGESSKPGKQVGLLPFSSRFPKFKLHGPWTKMLYGSPTIPPVELLPKGKECQHKHPVLNLSVGLSVEGTLSFTTHDWKLIVVPSFSVALSSPKLLRAEGLHLLRADNGEVGLSYDQYSSRLFFFFAKSPSKLSLQLHVDGTSTVIFKEKYIVVLDQAFKPRLVFSSPVLRLASKKTTTAALKWDSKTNRIIVAIPDQGHPIVIAFGLGVTALEDGFGLSFPSFKFGAKGEVELSESDSEDERAKQTLSPKGKKGTLAAFKSLFLGRDSPSKEPAQFGFLLGKSLPTTLFPKSPRVQRVKKSTSSSFSHPGVRVSLNLDASVEFYCGNWVLKATLPLLTHGPDTALYIGSEQLMLLKSGDFEEGLSVIHDTLHQFFILPPTTKTFTLRLQAEGTAEFDKSRGLTFSDPTGHASLTFETPSFSDANKTIDAEANWHPANKDLMVNLPKDYTQPIVLVFTISYTETGGFESELGTSPQRTDGLGSNSTKGKPRRLNNTSLTKNH